MWPQACPEDASQLSSLFSVNCIKTYHPIFHPERGRASSHLPRPAGEWGGGSQRRQVLSVSQRCHLWEHLWEGRGEREGFGAQKKSATGFFPSLSPSPAVLFYGQHHRTHHLLLQPCRGFPGGSRALENCKGLQESKLAARRGKSSARGRGRWGKRRKTKRKANCAPKPQAADQSYFFFHLNFLSDFCILLPFLSRVRLIFPSRRGLDCRCQQLQTD